jgi:zinc protease
MARHTFFAAIFLAGWMGALAAADVTRPIVPPFKVWNQVQSPALKEIKPPVAERVALPNGCVLFLLEDHELPVIELSMTLRFGEVQEAPELRGITETALEVMRSGGSEKWPADKLDAALDDMAATLEFSAGNDSSSVKLSILKEDFPRGLEILTDILRNPAFPQEQLDVQLSQERTTVSKRNDDPQTIVGREFRRAIYGPTSPYARVPEYATLAKIDRAALLAFHRANVHPGRFIVGVSGDFDAAAMKAWLTKSFGEWPFKGEPAPSMPVYATENKPRTLFVERPQINQTTVMMGHFLDIRRDNPDYPSLQIMNEILSGGMSSRMFNAVRTQKGLAYAVWGFASLNYDRPGLFYCAVLTRNEQAVDAVNAVREEVVRLRDGGIEEAELKQARETLVNSYVFNFDTPEKVIGRQMTYEEYGYPANFSETLLAAMQKVTVEDVGRVAKTYLKPEAMTLLGVGGLDGVDRSRSILGMKDAESVDVTIPPAPTKP